MIRPRCLCAVMSAMIRAKRLYAVTRTEIKAFVNTEGPLRTTLRPALAAAEAMRARKWEARPESAHDSRAR